MTCIAGAVKDGVVCIGGDAVTQRGNQRVRLSADGKVFRVGEFLIGSSGTVRCQQIIRYLFEPAPVEGVSDLTAYMVQEFIPALRQAIKEHGGEVKGESGREEMDACYLIGVRGRLFQIDDNYGVFESRTLYASVGCADQEALAAMFTVDRLIPNTSAEQSVRGGLLAAAEFDTSIRPPFTVAMLVESDWTCDTSTLAKSNGELKYLDTFAKV